MERVVVGVDASKNSEDALVWAAEAAAARSAELDIVHAMGHSVWGLDVESDRMLERASAALVEKRATLARHLLPGLVIRTVLSIDSPAHALITASKRAVLLVVGSGHIRQIGRSVTSPRSYQIAAAAHCPIAIVPGIPPVGAHGVVVGVDGSVDGVAAVALAAEEADRAREELCAVHAWDESAFPFVDDPMVVLDGNSRELAAVVLGESVAGLAERYPDLRVEQRLVKGAPSDAILEAAQDARLVVVGSRGRTGLTRLLLGSVSHDVVLAAPCPTVVTRVRPRTTPDR